MTGTGEFEPGLMAAEQNDQDAFTGIQHVSKVRSMHRDDGSLVSPESATSIEADVQTQVLPAKRRKRLRELKAAIAAGTYFVASGDLAERLMTKMLLD